MASKYLIVAVAHILLVQAAFSQYTSSGYGSGYSASGFGAANAILGGASVGLGGASVGLRGASLGLGGASRASLGVGSGIGLSNRLGVSSGRGFSGSRIGTSSSASGLTVASGSPLLITAISPIGPTGLAVASENAIEGNLLVTGQLPFLSAVAFEGALPTAGSGIATCGCGSGKVGITREGFGRPNIYY